MIRTLQRFDGDRRGASAAEFALVLPLLLLMIVGITQVGILYFAHSGLRSLVAEGARLASISPRPTHETIVGRLRQGGFGLDEDQLSEPVVTYGDTSGHQWADLELSYTVHLNFIFWSTGPFEIQSRRRVFLYPER
jgi:hypothetical protein